MITKTMYYVSNDSILSCVFGVINVINKLKKHFTEYNANTFKIDKCKLKKEFKA